MSEFYTVPYPKIPMGKGCGLNKMQKGPAPKTPKGPLKPIKKGK